MELSQPEKIQILRKRTGLNQGEFGAKVFNTSIESGRTKIKNIELGKQAPTAMDLKLMAEALEISVAELKAEKRDGDDHAKGNGIYVFQKVLDYFPDMGPYLDMLNNAAMIEDVELIDYIADKLSDLLQAGRQLQTAADQR